MKRLIAKIFSLIHDNFFAEENRFIVLIPFLFALGIAVYFALPAEPSPWISVGLFEFLLLIIYLFRHYRMLYLPLIGCLIVFCGFLNIQIHTLYQQKHLKPLTEKSITYIKGEIKDISINAKLKTRLLLQNASDYNRPLQGQYRLTANSLPELRIGDCAETVATLFPNRPLPILNGYRLDRKYFFENIAAVGFVNSEVFKIDCSFPKKTSLSSALNIQRKHIISEINKILPRQRASVAAALLVGDKSEISAELYDDYRNSGLAHILAVSGLHIGAVAGLIFFLVRFLIALFPSLALRFDSKKIAAIFSIIGSAFYLTISGMAIPAQRAFIMTVVVLIGILFNRRAISIRMVCFAALIILIISPQSLISISFQLSFAAVFALIAFYETYSAKLAKYRPDNSLFLKIIWYLSGIVICDFVASLATLPFSLYHFHRIAVYTSLANLCAGPLVALYIIPLVLVCLISLPFGLPNLPLILLGYGIDILNRIASAIANLPHSVFFYELNFTAFILIVLGGYWLCIWQRPWRRYGIVLIAFGLIASFYRQPQPDFVFSENAKQIALKNQNNEMIMLPLKKDSWLQNLWQENLHLKKLSDAERIKIKELINSETEDNTNNLNLRCKINKCTYKELINFDFKGNIYFNNHKLDTANGGYIYISQKKWQPLWSNKECRPWQNCQTK